MAGPQKKKPKPRRDHHRQWKTKRRIKDVDEVDEDMKEENANKLLNQEIDLDKLGAGQHYCLHCAIRHMAAKGLTRFCSDKRMFKCLHTAHERRYFITKEAMLGHFKTKNHKRRLRELEIEPYSHGEAERAAGKGSYFEPKRRKVETQPHTE